MGTFDGVGRDTLNQDQTHVAGGHQPKAVAVTATASGAGIPKGAGFVSVTSGNAAHIVVLPTVAATDVGMQIRGWVGSNGCEFQTPSGSDDTINGTDCDGSNEAAMPASSLWEANLVADGTWVLTFSNSGGDFQSGPNPDSV